MILTTTEQIILEKIFNAVLDDDESKLLQLLDILTTEELDMVNDQLCSLQGKILIVRRTTGYIEAYEGKRRRSE